MSSSPPRAGNALSLGLFLFPALHPSRIFLAFILISGNMNEGNQAGMQWSQTHTDRIPIKRGLEIIIDLLPTPSSTFLFLLCPLLPFLRHTVGLNRSAAHWSCAFNARAHTLEGSVPCGVPENLTVCAVNQTRKVWHHLTGRDNRSPSLSPEREMHKAYSERMKRTSSNTQR